mgnify:CR=1 FL=1
MELRPIDRVVDAIGVVGILLALYLIAMQWHKSCSKIEEASRSIVISESMKNKA